VASIARLPSSTDDPPTSDGIDGRSSFVVPSVVRRENSGGGPKITRVTHTTVENRHTSSPLSPTCRSYRSAFVTWLPCPRESKIFSNITCNRWVGQGEATLPRMVLADIGHGTNAFPRRFACVLTTTNNSSPL